MMEKLLQVIEDDSGRLSSTRLGLLIGISTFSFIMIAITFATIHVMHRSDFTGNSPDGGLLVGLGGIFAGLCTLAYGAGKISSDSVAKADIKANASPPNINIPNSETVNVKTEEGNVSVSS